MYQYNLSVFDRKELFYQVLQDKLPDNEEVLLVEINKVELGKKIKNIPIEIFTYRKILTITYIKDINRLVSLLNKLISKIEKTTANVFLGTNIRLKDDVVPIIDDTQFLINGYHDYFLDLNILLAVLKNIFNSMQQNELDIYKLADDLLCYQDYLKPYLLCIERDILILKKLGCDLSEY